MQLFYMFLCDTDDCLNFNRQIFFQVILRGNNSCDRIDNTDEGVEFALRFDNGTWIPVTVIYAAGSASRTLPIGNFSNLVIRDYYVDNQVMTPNLEDVNVSLTLCNFENAPDWIQFRWLQTTLISREGVSLRDFWGLDDMRISYIKENGEEVVLLSDSFDDKQLK